MKRGNGPLSHLYLPRTDGLNLWVPAGGNLGRRIDAPEFLPDLGIWVASADRSAALRSLLRSVPIEEFLAVISRTSWLRLGRGADLRQVMKAQGWKYHLALRDYQMAFLVRVMLQDFDWPGTRLRPSPDVRSLALLLNKCTSMVTNVLPRSDRRLGERVPGQGWALLMRIAYQQFIDFEEVRALYPRAILLYKKLAASEEARLGVTLDQVLRETIGLDFDEVLFLPFGLYSIFAPGDRGQLFDSDIMTNSPEFPTISRDLVQRLMDWLSIGYEEFSAACAQPELAAVKGYEPYNFNPLIFKPIIRTPSGLYVIPVAYYLVRRVTTGLFFDLINSPHQSKVGNIVGRAMELYVKRLIEDLPGSGRLMPEVQYAAGKSTSEWILDEPRAIVVIECKRFALMQRTRTTGNREDIKKDIGRLGGVADGIAKLSETAAAIHAGSIDGVDRTKPILSLLVTLDPFYLANAPYVRGIIEEVLRERGIHVADLSYQICPIPDFEEVCRLADATGLRLSEIVAEKTANRQHAESGFSEWIRAERPEWNSGRLPSHDEVYDDYFDSMVEKFYRSSESPE